MAYSDKLALEMADEYAGAVVAAGGIMNVIRNFGRSPAIIMVSLPAGTVTTPSRLVPGLDFKRVNTRTVPAAADQGITDEEMNG
jgi:hypothetical protein